MNTKRKTLEIIAAAMVAVSILLIVAIFSSMFLGCEGDQYQIVENPDGEFEVCIVNADPIPPEEYEVGKWRIVATHIDGPVSVLTSTRTGCYWFRGPSIDLLDVATITGRGTNPCFGDFNGELTLVRGAPARLTVERNAAPCTADYEADCRKVDDPIFDDLLESIGVYITPNLGGCCELYGNSQPVCSICPDFDLYDCPGELDIIDDGCYCKLDGDPSTDVDPILWAEFENCQLEHSKTWCCSTWIDPAFDAYCGR